MMAFRPMIARLHLLAALVIWACAASAEAASDATLFRLFLKDGGTFVSFGEYTRVDDRVVFSMPVGGPVDEPRLQVVWIPAASVDWARTDRYAESARYQHYADTQGEEDFAILNNEVARVLNDIALSTDRPSALALATKARAALAEWPRQHHGYRQDDVREIVALIDESIANLRAAGGATNFDLALVASTPAVPLEPVLGMPSLREQLDQVLRLATKAPNATDRVTLLQSALAMVNENGAGLAGTELMVMRASLETRIRADLEVDRRYGKLAQQLTQRASREAARARISGVEKAMSRLEREDAKLGKRRPELMESLRASIEASLGDARRLRLLRDQWVLRQAIYRDYQRTLGSQLLTLVKVQPQLEAIRRLDGPPLGMLQTLQSRLSGGAERLERIEVAEDLRGTHSMLIEAWRFAENAANEAGRRGVHRQRGPRLGSIVGRRRLADATVASAARHSGTAGATPSEVITPRTTRLVRVPDLQAFRRALVGLATGGSPLAARDRLVVVPTRAAAAQLVRTIESTALDESRTAIVLPDFATADELVFRLAERLVTRQPVLRDTEREALAMVACRAARDAGHEPPFRLRPGLVAEVLRFYDTLARYQKDVDTFERLALGLLEPGAAEDRGAERLVRQTRFLAAAFRQLEARQAEAGTDEHTLRALLVASPAPRPYRHVVVAVGDRSSDRYGLWPADWDLLARLPELAELDIVVTDTALAGDLHERLHHLLPGLDEVRGGDATDALAPVVAGTAGRSARPRGARSRRGSGRLRAARQGRGAQRRPRPS